MFARKARKQLGVTLIELIVVLAIIGTLLALLLPAVQAARERARETVCKNNLYQLNLGIVGYYEIHKKLPAPSQPGLIGGWTLDVLPFIEQKTLISDAPVTLNAPWANGPELQRQELLRSIGPHQKSFFSRADLIRVWAHCSMVKLFGNVYLSTWVLLPPTIVERGPVYCVVQSSEATQFKG